MIRPSKPCHSSRQNGVQVDDHVSNRSNSDEITTKKESLKPFFTAGKIVELANDVTALKGSLSALKKDTGNGLSDFGATFKFNMNQVANMCKQMAIISSEKEIPTKTVAVANSTIFKRIEMFETGLHDIAEIVFMDFEAIKQNQEKHWHLTNNFVKTDSLSIRNSIRDNLDNFLKSILSAIQKTFNNYQSTTHDLQIKNEILSDQSALVKRKYEEIELLSSMLQDQINKAEEQRRNKDQDMLKINEEKRNLEVVAQMLNDENDRLKYKVSDLEENVHIFRTDHKKYQTIIQDLENTVTDLESDKKISTSDFRKLICDFESSKKSLENERISNKKLSETLSSTTEDLKKVQFDYDQLKLQKLDLDNTIQNVTKDKCNYEVQIAETLKKLETSEKAVKILESSFGDLEGDKHNLENSLKQKEDVETSLRKESQDLHNRIKILQNDILHVEHLREELESGNLRLTDKLRNTRNTCEQLESELSKKNLEIYGLKCESENYVNKVSKLDADLVRLTQRCELFNKSSLKLNEAVKDLTKSNEDKDTLLSNQAKEIDKLRDVMAQKINENESLENCYFLEKSSSDSYAKKLLELQEIEKNLTIEINLLKTQLKELRLQKDAEIEKVCQSRNMLIEQFKIKETECMENVQRLKTIHTNYSKKLTDQKLYYESYFETKIKEIREKINDENDKEIKNFEEIIENLKLDAKRAYEKHNEELIRSENDKQKTLLMLQEDNQMITEKLFNLKSKFDDLEKENQILKGQFTEELELNELKIGHLNSHISDLVSKLDESKLNLENERNVFELKLRELNSSKVQLESDNDNLQDQLVSMGAKLIDSAEELKNTLEKLKEVKTINEDQQNEIESFRKEFVTIQSEKDSYLDTCVNLQGQIDTLETEKVDQSRHLEMAIKKLQNYENQIRDFENDNFKLIEEFQKTKLTLTDAENKNKKLDKDVDYLKRICSQKDKDEKELRNCLNVEIEDHKKAHRESVQLKKQILELEDSLQTLQHDNSKLKSKNIETTEIWKTTEKEMLAKLDDNFKKFQNFEAEIFNLEVCLSDASQQINDLNTRCETLQSKNKALNSEIQNSELKKRNLDQQLCLVVKSIQKITGIHIQQVTNFSENGVSNPIDMEIDIGSVKKGLRKLMNQFANLENERVELRKELSDTKSNLKSIENKYLEGHGKRNDNLNKIWSLENELKHVKLLLEEKDSNKKLVASAVDQYHKDMVELEWKISELELQNVSLREDNRKLEDEIRILRTKLTKIDDEKSKLSKLLQQRQTELSKNETNKIGFEGDLKRFQLLLQEKDANLSKLQEKCDKQSKYVKNVEDKCSSLKLLVEKLNATLDRQNGNEHNLQTELNELQHKLGQMQKVDSNVITKPKKFNSNKYDSQRIRKIFDINDPSYQKQIRSLESQIDILRNQINKNEDVFLVIRRKKLTIFTDVKESTKIVEVKKIIEGVTKIAPRNQQLFSRENQLMDDVKTVSYYGLNSHSAKPESPAAIGLAVRLDNGDFETLEVTTYSNPPDLPDVMKSSECNGIDQTI